MGVGPSTGSWLNFQRPHPQRKGALPPLKAIIGWRAAPQLWEAFPSPCCNVDWIIFCRQARLEWVHEFNSLIMTRRHCFSAVLLTSVFFYSPSDLISMTLPQPRREAMWHGCPFCSWALHRHLLAALWPAASFCINLHPPHKETSLMRSQCCANLQVERCKHRKQFDTMSI